MLTTITEHGCETTEEIEMGDVYQEVDELMTKLRVGMHKIKPSSRKYAFELPDIPKEAEYLKLMYPYDSKSLRRQLRLDTRLTKLHRAQSTDRPKRRDIFPRFWYKHCSF